MLVCAFVVRKPPKTGFLAARPIYEPEHKILILIAYMTAPSPIGPAKQFFQHKIGIIFLPISLNICFGCSKEPSHRDGSFE